LDYLTKPFNCNVSRFSWIGSNGKITATNELERSGCGSLYFNTAKHSPGETEENHEISMRIAGLRSGIGTEDPPSPEYEAENYKISNQTLKILFYEKRNSMLHCIDDMLNT
jgi:hypothetical protein